MAGYFTPYFTNYFNGVQGGHGSADDWKLYQNRPSVRVPEATPEIEEPEKVEEVVEVKPPSFIRYREEIRSVLEGEERSYRSDVAEVIQDHEKRERENQIRRLAQEELEAAETAVYLMNLGPERVKVSDEEAAEALIQILLRTLH